MESHSVCNIIRVITKLDDREAGVQFVNHEYVYRATSDDTKSHYQLIISITISDCKCPITCKCPINAPIEGFIDQSDSRKIIILMISLRISHGFSTKTLALQEQSTSCWEKKCVFYISPSQERVRHFPSQEVAKRLGLKGAQTGPNRLRNTTGHREIAAEAG